MKSALLPVVLAVYWLMIGDSVAKDDDPVCSNNCSVDNENGGLECFTTSQGYYDKTVVNALRDWLAVQDSIEQWHWRKTDGYKGFNVTARSTETVDRWNQLLSADKELLDKPTITTVANTLVAKIINEKTLAPPDYHCPIPCSYNEDLWKYMFIASALLNAALFASVIPFMVLSLRNERRLYQPHK